MVFHAFGVDRRGFLIDSQRNEKSEDRFVAFSGSRGQTFSLSGQLDRTIRCRVDEAFRL